MIPAPDVIPFDDCPVAPMEAPTGLIHTVRPDYSAVREQLKKFIESYPKTVVESKPDSLSWSDGYGTSFTIKNDEPGVLYITPTVPTSFIHITLTITKEPDVLKMTRNFVDNFR